MSPSAKEHLSRGRRRSRSPSLELISRSPTPEYPPSRPLGGRPSDSPKTPEYPPSRHMGGRPSTSPDARLLSRSPSLENISRSPTPTPISPTPRSRLSPTPPPPRQRQKRRRAQRTPSPVLSPPKELGPQSPSPSPPSSPSPSSPGSPEQLSGPASPPSRPMTRGQRVMSSDIEEQDHPRREMKRHHPAVPSPDIPHRTRRKHNAPDRFSPPLPETRRGRPSSPVGRPPTKRGKKLN